MSMGMSGMARGDASHRCCLPFPLSFSIVFPLFSSASSYLCTLQPNCNFHISLAVFPSSFFTVLASICLKCFVPNDLASLFSCHIPHTSLPATHTHTHLQSCSFCFSAAGLGGTKAASAVCQRVRQFSLMISTGFLSLPLLHARERRQKGAKLKFKQIKKATCQPHPHSSESKPHLCGARREDGGGANESV